MTIRFGTDGWRAVIADEFTIRNVTLVTEAIGRYLYEHGMAARGVVVGYDNRFMSERFAQASRDRLLRLGVPVLYIDKPSPTPVVAYAVTQNAAAGAIVFTASHNPPEYQGIKFIPDYAGPAFPEITREIEEYLTQLQDRRLHILANPMAQELHIDPFSAYGSHVLHLIGSTSLAGLRVVVDPMHGSGGYLAPLLEELGAEVKRIRDTRDAFFGGGLPEPTRKRLSVLSQAVLATGADLGLAMDGDADRFGVIGHGGEFYPPNQVLALLYSHFLDHQKKRGSVARTVATTRLLDRIASRHGMAVHETPVGFKHIARHLLDGRVLLGGEESGGLSLRGHIPEKDGILACLLVAQVVAELHQPLADSIQRVFKTYGYLHSIRRDVPIGQGDRSDLLQRLASEPPERLGSYSVAEVRRVDGLEFRFGSDALCLIRLSGTEDVARVYIEAQDQRQAEEIQQLVCRYYSVQ